MKNKTSEALLCRARLMVNITDDSRVERIEDAYIFIKDEIIQEAGPFSASRCREIIASVGQGLKIVGHPGSAPRDGNIFCGDAVILPAFVKAHGHDHEQLLIGIAKDLPLTQWLDGAVNPFTKFLNENEQDLKSELGMSPQLVTYLMARVSDIHYGITASMVHHCNFSKYRAREIAQANEAAGTAMIVALGSQDRFYFEELLDTPEEALSRLNEAASLPGLTRTSFCPGPDQFFSNSRTLLKPLKEWARERETLFHIHSSEEPKTTQWFQKEIEPGMTPVEYADSLGILDERSVLAHQVNCGPRDIEILAKRGTKIVHNPLANTILGSGMPPVIEMRRAGIPVAISTDGSGSADNQNILAAARAAAQYQKAHHQDATLLTSEELIEMITRIPAAILGRNQGQLAPGKQGDFVLINLDRPNMTPTRKDNVVENLIWASDGSEVDTVVASGRVLKENGKILPFIDGTDPHTIMAKVNRLSALYQEHRQKAPALRGTGAHRD